VANGRSLKVVKEQNPFAAQAVKKLSIACGQNKPAGFKGIDLAGDADIQHDLFKFPWPIKTSSVQEVECSHFVEHIPHRLPGINRDVWWEFFDELHRVLKKGGTATIVHPYSRSDRAFWDPTHERFIHEMTWHYLNKEWREMNKLDHYPVSCDFEIVTINGVGLDPGYESRNAEQQQYMTRHYFNVLADLQVTLQAR